MRLQKTLVETHEFPNGEIQAILYDNDDKVVRIVMIDEEGQPILSESERKALGDELKMFNTQNPVKAHKSAVKRQQDEYQPVNEKIEEISQKVADEVVQKGFLSNLIGIGAIASMLPNKERDRLERLADKEMERAERIREINRKKLLRGRGNR